MEKFDADKAHSERKARIARRAAVRGQILEDQKSNAKRDEEAQKREAEWRRENGK